MNVQIKVSDLVYMLDSNIPISQAARAVKDQARQAEILMPTPEPGPGYMVWRLPGEGWISFDNLPESEKPEKATLLSDRLETLKKLIGNPEVASRIVRVPATRHYFFRSSNGMTECALVGWAYRYPESHSGDELEAWINRVKKQDVSLGFVWDGKLIPLQSFTIRGVSNKTPSGGLFHIGMLPVGSSYEVVHKPTERRFSLDVTEGKARYEFDLTVTLNVDILVRKDGEAAPDTPVTVSFGGKTHTVTTDVTGRGRIEFPLISDGDGMPSERQPECAAACHDKTQEETPDSNWPTLSFYFDFESEKPEEPPVIPPLEEPEPEKPEPEPEKPEPEPEKPEPAPEKPEPPKEPEFVTIQLTDVLDTPIADAEFFLTTKLKKKMRLRTDRNGECVLPKEWFTPGEKMHFDLHLSKEYCETHGIELDRKKRKKK